MRRSIRPDCPHCNREGLTAGILRTPADKLDNGDPDFRQYTICGFCKKYVFVTHDGLHLEPGMYHETK